MRWQTSFEQDVDAFVVWRATSEEGAYKAVSSSIPASQSLSGASYEWLDDAISPDADYWYKLQSLPDGEFFGPIPARADPGADTIQVFAPLVLRMR